MKDWERIAEDRIRVAIQAGEFDQLPGKGQPLRLDENPFAAPDTWIAHRLLHSNGFSLPWIEERRELQTEIETARAKLARAAGWVQDTLAGGAEAGWDRARKAFQEQATDLNRRIRNFNLKAPSASFHLPLVDAEWEIERIMPMIYE